MAETETVVKSTTGRYSGASGTRYAAVAPAYKCRKCTNMQPDSRTSPSIRGKARDTHDRQRHTGAGYARAGADVDPLWLQRQSAVRTAAHSPSRGALVSARAAASGAHGRPAPPVAGCRYSTRRSPPVRRP